MARFRISGTAWDGQRWRLVPCGVVFAQQIEAARPTPHPADGTVAGKAHDQNSPNSDHTVWPKTGSGHVFAIDVGDSEGTVPDIWDELRRSQDERIMYGINEGRMFSSYPTSLHKAWTWRPYNGPNPHKGHGHLSWQNHMSTGRLSASRTWELVNDQTPFQIGGIAPPGEDDEMALKEGDRGNAVSRFQQALVAAGYDIGPSGADGIFGPATAAAVKLYQKHADLSRTGEIDGVTAALLLEWVADRVGGGGGLTQAQADARYARLGHPHTVTIK